MSTKVGTNLDKVALGQSELNPLNKKTQLDEANEQNADALVDPHVTSFGDLPFELSAKQAGNLVGTHGVGNVPKPVKKADAAENPFKLSGKKDGDLVGGNGVGNEFEPTEDPDTLQQVKPAPFKLPFGKIQG